MQIISEESSKGRRVDRKHMPETKGGVAKVKDEKKFVMQLAWNKGGRSQMCEVPVLKTNP